MKHLYHEWTFNADPRPGQLLYTCRRCGKPSRTKARDICPGVK